MSTKNQSPAAVAKSTSNTLKKSYLKPVAAALIAALLFASGWAFGGGNISLRNVRNGSINVGRTLSYDSVDELYSALVNNYDGKLTDSQALDGIKKGLAQSTSDPYTEYFNNEESKEFQQELSGSFEGIGAELGKDGTNVVVISPISGSPAEKAGVKSKDIIVKIDDTNATDMTITQAVKLIRGKAGTDVKLTLARDGNKVEITITRAQITIPSVKWEVKDGVGIMTVSRFSEDTPALAAQAADAFKNANVKGVVLDMRSNPGGLLDSAVKLSSLWLDNGKTILLEKQSGKVVRTYTATGKPVLKGVKTVVLINEGSASASEITAGALHDNGVATLIGTKSYGKGSVQQIIELTGGGTIKVTVARWYTPNDKNIDKEGISPDKEVSVSDEDFKNKRDPQLDAALASF